MAEQSDIPKYFNISRIRGWPCKPLLGFTLRNVTLQLLCRPAKSDVRPVPKYRSTKNKLRLAIRAAAAAASFGALALAIPNPAHPFRFPINNNMIYKNDNDIIILLV